MRNRHAYYCLRRHERFAGVGGRGRGYDGDVLRRVSSAIEFRSMLRMIAEQVERYGAQTATYPYA